MATKQWQCPTPGCDFQTDDLEANVGIEFLKLHVNQNHGNAAKPEKPKRPLLAMSTEVIEHRDWSAFQHQFANYKKLANISGQAANHLLECLSPEVYRVLFDTYGGAINDMAEDDLTANLEHLVVRKRNKLAQVMELLAAKQDSGQKILGFLSQLKSKARHCQLSKTCKCGRVVYYTDEMVLFRLVAGVSDPELQEDLLKVENLSLNDAEKLSIAKESAKNSQAEMIGESASKLQSEYKRGKLKVVGPAEKCLWCGRNKHEDRVKECPAYGQECLKCGRMNHFKRQCKSSSKVKDKSAEVKEETKPVSKATEESDSHLYAIAQGTLSHVSTADLMWDKQTK